MQVESLIQNVTESAEHYPRMVFRANTGGWRKRDAHLFGAIVSIHEEKKGQKVSKPQRRG